MSFKVSVPQGHQRPLFLFNRGTGAALSADGSLLLFVKWASLC